MAERTNGEELRHELGSYGDQDILRGPPATDDTEFVTIGQADDPFEADLLTAALDEAGITVAARAQRDHLVDTLVNPNKPFWAIQVPAQDEVRAREILEWRQAEMRAMEPAAEEAAEEEERRGEQPGA